MTVIAYDGKSVAADRQSTNNGIRFTCKKLFTVEDNRGFTVLAPIGDHGHGVALVAWWTAGADPEQFPAKPADAEKAAYLAVIQPGAAVKVYQGYTVPVSLLDNIWAEGSGRDMALGAMLAGATARKAVELTCTRENGCGMGIDVVELYDALGGAATTTARPPASLV